MTRDWDGWADDYETQEERWDRQYQRHADLRAAADAAALARSWRQQLQEMRHQGEDDGAHHWSRVTGLRCPCGCMSADALSDDSSDPIDILGRRAVDPLTAREYAEEDRRLREQEEMRAWLEAHRPRNVGPPIEPGSGWTW